MAQSLDAGPEGEADDQVFWFLPVMVFLHAAELDTDRRDSWTSLVLMYLKCYVYIEIRNPGAPVLLTQACALKSKGALSLGTWALLLDLIFPVQAISF